jgi:hypothetical protein
LEVKGIASLEVENGILKDWDLPEGIDLEDGGM